MTNEPQPDADVRMRGFARRTTVADALAWLDGQASRLSAERVPVAEAAGRVLAREVRSEVDVPGFTRSMMDGFAVRASDTSGASPYNRLRLDVVGQSMPGRPFEGTLAAGQAVRIMTGAPLPEGADAVLPVEVVEIGQRDIHAQGEVSPGKHVGRVGEDVAAGAAVLAEGRVLRPQDVGVLASIGVAEVPVVRRPRVRIVVTGDELLPVGSKPRGCRIVDSNGPMLGALAERDGGVPLHPGIVPDEPEAILRAIRSEADVVLVSGGSSVGQEDHAPSLVREHGELAIHGLAMRPSSPTGMGRLDDRLVFLLPGNPVSCLCAYDFFAGRAIRALGGRSTDWPYRRIRAPLARKIVSVVGRLDYLRVRLVEGRVDPVAIGGASVLSSTTRADGFVLVPPDSEGHPPGAEVEVFLYD
ncbi:MAG TPA: gephyrin-like molybdotransferase Glp [Thermoguttaceae bacterium]|nr:gephyrin-like molybdotransferase Glp [Thermoguttaceae bacterium]